MRTQLILDTRPGFQNLVTNELKLMESYAVEIRTKNDTRLIRATKVRLFTAAIRAAYYSDRSRLTELAAKFEPLNTISHDRNNKGSDNLFITLYPSQMDYIKAGCALLAIGHGVRLDERSYAHLCIYYFASLTKRNKIANLILSGELHPFSLKK